MTFPEQNAGTRSQASVVMPVHRYTDHTREQVRALARQSTERDWELLIVGDEATRETAMDDLSNFPVPVRWVVVPDGCGEPFARNQGSKAAHGKLILACDSDDLVSTDWVDRMLDAFDDPSLDAVGGHVEEELLNDPDSHQLRYPFTPGGLPLVLELFPRAVGANFGVRKIVWDALGGFDTAFTWSCDTEFFMRLQASGYKLGYCPDAVIHYRHGDHKESIRKVYHWNRTRPRLYKKFRPHGACRDPAWAKKWATVIASSWLLFTGRRSRLTFYGRFLRRWGRFVGSLRYGAWYP